MSSEARRVPNVFPATTLVTYRFCAAGLGEPPEGHRRLADGEYIAPYDPRLELLDAAGAIEVSDWGDGP